MGSGMKTAAVMETAAVAVWLYIRKLLDVMVFDIQKYASPTEIGLAY